MSSTRTRRPTQLDAFSIEQLISAAAAFEWQATHTHSADRIAMYTKRAGKYRAEAERRTNDLHGGRGKAIGG